MYYVNKFKISIQNVTKKIMLPIQIYEEMLLFTFQDDFMHMLRSADAPGEDLPWTGLFTGMLIGKYLPTVNP